METELQPGGLTIATTLEAGREGPVPVSFGFHPYVGLPGLPRAQWTLSLPAMRRLELDSRGIPTGEDTAFEGFDGPLGDAVFDDGFALAGARRCLHAEWSRTKSDRRFHLRLPVCAGLCAGRPGTDRARADDGTDKRVDDGSEPADRRAG